MRVRMGPFQILCCYLGRHHRDRHRTRRNSDGHFVSRCKGCNKRMMKDSEGWKMI